MARQSRFGDMVDGVETNLHRMRKCERIVNQREAALMNARNDLAEAEVEFNASKAALFREFPEMAPKAPAAAETPVTPPTPQPATPEPVPSPQGGLVFREMDDDYDPFAGG